MDTVMTAIQGVPVLGPYIPWLTLGITLASFIATALPAPGANDGTAYRIVYGLLNKVALNVGHATNASAPK